MSDTDGEYTAEMQINDLRAQLARLRAREAELVEALWKLRNEVSGMLSIAPELREIVGNTNLEVLELRLGEADATLARVRTEKGERT